MKIILLFIFIGFNSFGQTVQKQNYIFNEKGETITQQTFVQKSKTAQYTRVVYETKDSLVARLILREVYGELSSDKKELLINNLKEITGHSINKNQTIIINFAFNKSTPNQPHCLDYYSSVKSYRNYFKKKEQFAQFYISQQNFKYSKDFVFEDKNDVIRKMLFQFGSDCNYIIIKPDGKFYRQMSEHHQNKIPEKAIQNW